MSLDDLTVIDSSAGNGQARVVIREDADPKQRALQSLCLLILNLNEVLYVD